MLERVTENLLELLGSPVDLVGFGVLAGSIWNELCLQAVSHLVGPNTTSS